MIRRMISVLPLALCAVLPIAADATVCGTKIQSLCCESFYPTDSSCICLGTDPLCRCSKSNGNPQGGTMTICELGYWSYHADTNNTVGYAESPSLCSVVNACTTPGEPPSSSCTCNGTPTCEWRLIGFTNAYEIIHSGPCGG